MVLTFGFYDYFIYIVNYLELHKLGKWLMNV